VKEAVLEATPLGCYVTSDAWFVVNLADALAVRNEEKGGAVYPLEGSWEPRFLDFGVNVRVLWPGEPNALYHAEGAQEGFFVLSGECTLIVEDEERPLRQWDYFHCPTDTRHVLVGAGDGPCAILAIGARPEGKTVCFPVSDVAAAYGASAPKQTDEPDEAYADWPGEYLPVRLHWPLDSDATLGRTRHTRGRVCHRRVVLPLTTDQRTVRSCMKASCGWVGAQRSPVTTDL
jgi:uncharacterized cupin superfamily protein